MTRFARAEGSKGSNKREYEEATPWEVMKSNMVTMKKKKKKDKKKSSDTNVNSHVNQVDKADNLGKCVASEHSDGPLKKKKKSKDKSMDSDVVVKVSTSDQQEEKDNTVIKKKKKEKKGVSLEQLKKNWVIEDGIKYKIFKDGTKKPWFDLAYEENEVMTRYKNFFVKREMVDELDQHKKSLEEQGLDNKQVTKMMLHKERKFHNQLRLELLRTEIKEKSVPSETKISHKVKRKKHLNISSDNHNKTQNAEMLDKYTFRYEENELMTQFEGYWILRENLAHIQEVAKMKFSRIIQKRADGSMNQNLTSEEELFYRRVMKKEKRREGKLLKTRIFNNNNNLSIPRSTSRHYNENSRPRNKQGNDDIIKFDGYFIRRDGAERLTKLRETMAANRCTEEEIESTMKNERRKEERLLKRENKLFCFKCRNSGHMVSSCPESSKEGQDGGYDVCFRCGSAEHMARNCVVKSKGGAYPLATCFICKEIGHISRECPDNPKGLYPNGGCCKECGSVEHLKKDCPDLQKQNEENTIKLNRFHQGEEIEQMEPDFQFGSQPVYGQKRKSKIIIFDD